MLIVDIAELLVDMFVEFVEISDALVAISVSLELIFEVFVEILDVLVAISESFEVMLLVLVAIPARVVSTLEIDPSVRVPSISVSP